MNGINCSRVNLRQSIKTFSMATSRYLHSTRQEVLSPKALMGQSTYGDDFSILLLPSFPFICDKITLMVRADLSFKYLF